MKELIAVKLVTIAWPEYAMISYFTLQILSILRNGQQLSFEWFDFEIFVTDSNIRITSDTIKSITEICCSEAFT